MIWLFALLALAPAAAYLQVMFPDWSLLYVVPAHITDGASGVHGPNGSPNGSMSRAMPILAGLAMIASALLGWAAAERAGRRFGRFGWPQATSRLLTALLFGLLGLLLALIVRGRLRLVGTYEQFHDGQWLMQPLLSTSSKLPLALLVINAGVIVALALGVQLLRWRSDLLIAPTVPAPHPVTGAAASELPAPTSPVPISSSPARVQREGDPGDGAGEASGYESQSAR